MIRPLTCLTFLLACGSGLYLYQSKHQVQLLDRQIERAVHETDALREQSRALRAEWMLLNDPERLRQFADEYLSLKPIMPTQFTSMAELDSRLPPPTPNPPPAEVPVAAASDATPADAAAVAAAAPATADADATASADAPAGAATADAGGDEAPPAVADQDLPVPPLPAAPTAVASVPSAPRVAEHKPTQVAARPDTTVASVPRQAEPRSARAEPQRQESRSAEPRVAEARPAPPRPIELRPSETRTAAASPSRTPVRVPAPMPAAQLPPSGGSLLGMARGANPPVPLPRPTPVSVNEWN